MFPILFDEKGDRKKRCHGTVDGRCSCSGGKTQADRDHLLVSQWLCGGESGHILLMGSKLETVSLICLTL